MLTIAICDDSPEHRERNTENLRMIGQQDDIVMDIRTYCSGEEFIEAYKEQELEIDLIYMDIEMGALSGVETARQLRIMGCRAKLVFLTVSGEYVLDSLDTDPEDYLRKDEISFKQFKEDFEQYYTRIQREQASSLIVLQDGEAFMRPMDEFLYFTKQEEHIWGTMKSDRLIVQSDWSSLIDMGLESGFLLLNDHCLLQLCCILKISEDKVCLINGDAIELEMGQCEHVTRSLCEQLAR